MKKIITSLLFMYSFSFSQELNLETFTGDTKLSCEAILCLSSGTRPSECNEAIRRYFSISFRKWGDTVRARRAFLNICPVGAVGNNDTTFQTLRDDIIANLDMACSLENLNRVERRYIDDGDSYVMDYNNQYRTNPELLKSCKLLMNSSYTYFKPKYTCDPNKWYSYNDWQSGYETIRITSYQYQRLSNEEKKEYTTQSDDFSYYYYKKVPINKNCWIFEE